MATELDARLQALSDAVAKETVIDTAVLTFIQGVPALIDAAVLKAQEAGATPTQLEAISTLSGTITTNAQTLSDAITTGTTPPPV